MTSDKKYKIYIIQNTENSSKYVGMTSLEGQRRLINHKKEMHLDRPLYCDMRSLGFDKFYMVDVTSQCLTYEEASKLEREVVKILLDNNEVVYNIYLSGQIPEKVRSLRSRLLLGNSNRKGIPHTEETKKRISESTRGVRRSLSTRRRISESQLGDKNHRSKRVRISGTELEFDTLKQCYEYIKSSMYPSIGYTTVKRLARGELVSKYDLNLELI